MAIDVTFLKQHAPAQAPEQVAQLLADFLGAARASLHLAIYDFRLHKPSLARPVLDALRGRAAAGVEVRVAFDAGHADPHQVGADPAPEGTEAFLRQALGPESRIQFKPIHGEKLMHNKYVVRDGPTKDAALWTGSANLTDDALTLQESNIVRVTGSPALCNYYETDFNELWTTGQIDSTGVGDTGTADVDGTAVGVAFSPGQGVQIDAAIANQISGARRRIRLCSMILTSRTILGALGDALHHGGVDFQGVYDRTQMVDVREQWKQVGHHEAVTQMFDNLAARMSGKDSQPYQPNSPHDFMHNKVVVCDDVVVTGSFNFSRSATFNSENVLFIHNAEVAARYCAYIEQLAREYGKPKEASPPALAQTDCNRRASSN
jgi:phosphatidylserine/phosphatidylglycerophosphate/cardiolipin synthase-like enzyme